MEPIKSAWQTSGGNKITIYSRKGFYMSGYNESAGVFYRMKKETHHFHVFDNLVAMNMPVWTSWDPSMFSNLFDFIFSLNTWQSTWFQIHRNEAPHDDQYDYKSIERKPKSLHGSFINHFKCHQSNAQDDTRGRISGNESPNSHHYRHPGSEISVKNNGLKEMEAEDPLDGRESNQYLTQNQLHY